MLKLLVNLIVVCDFKGYVKCVDILVCKLFNCLFTFLIGDNYHYFGWPVGSKKTLICFYNHRSSREVLYNYGFHENLFLIYLSFK